MPQYLTSVGMEVHAELLTASKMFCRCPVGFGGEPNTRVCPVCLGLPGALPVPNRLAIEMVLKTALALNCSIAYESVFHRKNYFYPDLPKGFQTSQYGETNPFGHHGWLDIRTDSGATKRIHIRRVHLEEDTGKLTHVASGGSGVDYNRAGVPLMEIVTDFPPDIETAEEAKEYLVQLRAVLVWLGVCDGKMEQGSLRCEPNISVRAEGSDTFGTKTELKNLNSFRSVQLGVEFEAKRQAAVLEQGGTVTQETRGWNESTLSSFLMRRKEEEQDYRYFTCPDLTPMRFDHDYIEGLRVSIPELPGAKRARFVAQFGLSDEHAEQLASDRRWCAFFEDAVEKGAHPQTACNWMNGDLARLLNDSGADLGDCPFTPAHLADLCRIVDSGAASGKVAKSLLAEAFESGAMPSELLETKGLTQVSDGSYIEEAVRLVLSENPQVVEQFKAGKENVVGFLVGQVMRATGGRANPALVQEETRRQLGK